MDFDQDYFESRGLVSEDGHPEMVAMKIQEFFPGTVLDIGCGLGYTVHHLRKAGVQASGLDISQFAVDNRTTDYVELGDFADCDTKSDVILVSQLLQCLDSNGVKVFATWAKTHCNKHLIILNSPGIGGEHTRSSSHYKEVFESCGWKSDEYSYRKLHSTTGWDCLVLTCNSSRVIKKPILTSKHLVVSLVVDCWSGDEYLSKFLEHIKSLLLVDLELILVNTSRCSSIESLLTPRSDWSRSSLAEHTLLGTNIPVVVVDEGARSVTRSFSDGLTLVSGSTVMLVRITDQISPLFLAYAVQHLLDHPSDSFVAPSFFITSDTYQLGWLKGLGAPIDILASLVGSYGGEISIPYGGLIIKKTASLQLSGMSLVDFIPPVFLARTEDMSDIRLDSQQDAYSEKDLLLSMVYQAKLGYLSEHISSLSFLESERFTEQECAGYKARLLNRPRKI